MHTWDRCHGEGREGHQRSCSECVVGELGVSKAGGEARADARAADDHGEVLTGVGKDRYIHSQGTMESAEDAASYPRRRRYSDSRDRAQPARMPVLPPLKASVPEAVANKRRPRIRPPAQGAAPPLGNHLPLRATWGKALVHLRARISRLESSETLTLGTRRDGKPS